ncbi:MAG: hypothetical protein GY861_27040, partial [bacterium]|nr:hypothetical protein [bacterium]
MLNYNTSDQKEIDNINKIIKVLEDPSSSKNQKFDANVAIGETMALLTIDIYPRAHTYFWSEEVQDKINP